MTSLRLADVTFSYDDCEGPIVENFSYELDEGTISLISGPSGCGKSTVFKLMAGLLPQYGGKILSGKVLLENAEIESVVPFERAKRVAMLFQNPNRQFAMKNVFSQFVFALENLQLDHQEIEERINDALKRFELEDFKDRNLQELSGGEQQRIALALVYSLKSSVILLDEPFANVDPENRSKLLEDLKRLQKEQRKTILISDHDSSGYFGIVDHWYRFSSQGFVEKDINELKTREQQPKVIGVPKNAARLFWDDLGFEVSKRKLLSNSSFCLPTGQIGLLSGKNGCGKSTLFACLCKLHEKTGKITFDQKDSDKIKLSKWAKNVGYAFQNSLDQFIKLTVEEEILASRKNTRHKDYWSEERIQKAIKALNLTGVMKHSVYRISGGQQKKLQLLVMLIMAQPILLIDEPFAGLDQESLEVSCSLLKETVKNLQLSVLLISHQRVRVVSFMDYEISLEDGNLKEVSA